MEKIDFCFVIGSVPLFRPTGGDDVIFNLIRRLKDDGYRVNILVIENLSKWIKNYFNSNKVEIYDISLSKKLYFFLQRNYSIRYLFPLIRKLKGADYDFSFLKNVKIILIKDVDRLRILSLNRIFATWWATAFYVADDRVKAQNKYYLIQNNEDDRSFSGKASSYARDSYSLHNLRKIVINGEMEKRFIRDNPLKFNVGIDYDLWHYIGKKENIILFPLRSEEYKGTKYMLEAARILMEKTPEYQLISFGNLSPSKVPDYIEHHYKIKNTELVKLYKNSKIFILPSIVEGFSLAGLQAMASNCGIVSTDSIGIREFMRNNQNAVIVQTRSAEEIVTGVLKLIKSPDFLIELLENAQETVKRYTYDNMYNQFIKLFS